MTVLRYLAYGSNLHPERLMRRTPSARLITTCVLHGWRLGFEKRGQDGSAKATINRSESSGDHVHAAIYDIAADEKPLLDRIEGLNRGYHQEFISLPEIGLVWTYRAERDHTDRSLVPFRWYRDLVVIGARFHGFPDVYVERLASHAAEDDPDSVRQREHDSLLRAMRDTIREP